MQWKRFGWVCGRLELANTAIEEACTEGAGSDGRGQDAQGVTGFGEGAWKGWERGMGEFTPTGRRERIEVWDWEDCWLGHVGVWSVLGWDGEGATSITAGSGCVTG